MSIKILNSLKPLKIGSFRILESRMNLLKHSTSSVSYIKKFELLGYYLFTFRIPKSIIINQWHEVEEVGSEHKFSINLLIIK